MKSILLNGLFVSVSVLFITSSASAMTCTNLTKSLSKGSENSEVLKLQQFLFDGGYLTVKPNGYFGNGTVLAVKKFQKANSLSQAGTVGPATRSAVKSISCESSKEFTSVSSKTVSDKTKVPENLDKNIQEFVIGGGPLLSACDFNTCFLKKLETCSPFKMNFKHDFSISIDSKTRIKDEGTETFGIIGEQSGKCQVVSLGEFVSKETNKKIKYTSSCLLGKNEFSLYSPLFLNLSENVIRYLSDKISLIDLEKAFSSIQNSSDAKNHNCFYQLDYDQMSSADKEKNAFAVRNKIRTRDVHTILLYVAHYLENNNNKLPSSITATPKETCLSSLSSCEGMIEPWLTPAYLPIMPIEPGATKKNGSGYLFSRNGNTVTVSSQFLEGDGKVISESYKF